MKAYFAKAIVLTLACAAAIGCSDDSDEPASSGGRASGGRNGASGSSSSGDQAGAKARGGENSGGKPGQSEAGETSVVVGGAGETEPGVEPGPAPIYALTTQVFGENDSQSYVLLTGNLDGETELSIEQAVIEIPGRALASGPDDAGALYVASDQGPNVTRYELDDEGKLVKGKSISFLATGVTKFGEYSSQFQHVSADKAYWFDGATAQMVVWDPTAMKVTGSVGFAELATAGQVLSFTTAPVRDGDMLYLFAAWRTGLVVTSRVAVIAVDTRNDEISIVEDDRCGYVRDGVLRDGYLYLASEAFGSAAHWLDASNPAPCLLRFDTATREFDPGFHVELADLMDGAAAGSLIAGPGDRAFLRVLHGQSTPENVTNPRVVASASAWSWVSVTLGDEPTVAPVEAPLSSGSVLRFALGDRIFAPLFREATDTTFLELTDEGPKADALSLPGLVFSAVKLR
jgi:hypothetical protein